MVTIKKESIKSDTLTAAEINQSTFTFHSIHTQNYTTIIKLPMLNMAPRLYTCMQNEKFIKT